MSKLSRSTRIAIVIVCALTGIGATASAIAVRSEPVAVVADADAAANRGLEARRQIVIDPPISIHRPLDAHGDSTTTGADRAAAARIVRTPDRAATTQDHLRNSSALKRGW